MKSCSEIEAEILGNGVTLENIDSEIERLERELQTFFMQEEIKNGRESFGIV
ncbi:hypothetical protein J41TS12_17760 [Paenibacillus antibioticophila]|uniref:Uncharacterized protein n=1 Tax=Paenibacillus antibioticophila TaxID=1274374 RepID=A0A919XU21_9BACL|nr:hypothetical protein [Paenibacillus antibioticophila]GIO36915.1 hypothetical protein J41TS12_17760 [Paenibacillus antibioticophila]